MKMAQKANASVLLISDIDKGGSFASIVGTVDLIEKKYKKLLKGFIFNKFRGDIDVLKPGFKKIKQLTTLPVLGTIPFIQLDLPDEDSLNKKPKNFKWTKKNILKIDQELNELAHMIQLNLDMKKIEQMIQ